MFKKYLAEFIGTFALSFTILAAVSFSGALPIAVPLIAGLTLALFVYTIGSISGCHINPAITLGLLSIKKINLKDSIYYIISQFLGALCAILVAKLLLTVPSAGVSVFNLNIFTAEMLGAVFFSFGIASVVIGGAKEQMSGLIVGGSLLLGVLISSLSGAMGILNPAVALALNSFTLLYIFAPIIGAVIGFQLYNYLVKNN